MFEKYYDERSLAETMAREQKFIKRYSVDELSIYGKWLKYKRLVNVDSYGEYNFDIDEKLDDEINKAVEAELIDFSSKHYGAFNYNLNYHEIDSAMNSIKSYKLKLPLPLPITEKEYQTLLNIENEVYRKILFCMLVSAKYNIYYSTSLIANRNNNYSRFFVQMSDLDIFKAADVKFENREVKAKIWNRIKNDIPGYCGISSGKLNKRFIYFADFDAERNNNPIDYITDYSNLKNHYDKLFHNINYSVCKYCGKLFKQNAKNNTLFCSKHRGYIKNDELKTCKNCGSLFYAKSSKKIYCDKCRKHITYIKRRDDL